MPVPLGELAALFGCELRGDPDTLIERVGTLQEAGAAAAIGGRPEKYAAMFCIWASSNPAMRSCSAAWWRRPSR